MAISLTAPEPANAIELAKVEAVPVIQDDEADSMLPALDQNRVSEIRRQAQQFVTTISTLDSNSPAFGKEVEELRTLAASEMVKTGEGPSRLLSRASTSVAGAKKSGGDVQVRVASSLADLRSTVDDLTPNPGDLSTTRKILGFIPGGNKVSKYFQKYESAQTQLDNIIKALMHGQDELRKDNASLDQERRSLWDNLNELNEYAYFAKELDSQVVAQIESLKNSGAIDKANKMESDVLFEVRQRHQDILTQIAVGVQGYLAMDLVKKNNVELIKGVERARTTTVTALRTAIIVAEALTNQKLVLDQIDAVNATTNKLIGSVGEMLKQNTARVHEQAASSGVSTETLQKAFDDIYSTMDAIDTFKAQANTAMESTISNLSGQITKATPYLERSRQQEALGAGANTQGQIAR